MPAVRPQDILDILILSILAYQLYSWFRSSHAVKVLTGLAVVMAIFFITRYTGMNMTSWVLQQLETVMIVLVVVVFQNEIRQALYRFSLLREFIGGVTEHGCTSPAEVADAVFELASKKTGAIIVFERQEQLDDHLLHGVPVDARLSSALLSTLFSDGTPLHDGAVLVRNERIVTAACLLPLSGNPNLPQQYGTRHRAALGLAERTDAVVLVVSEERGEVSVAFSGKLEAVSDKEQLKSMLESLLVAEASKTSSGFTKRLFSDLVPKTAILLVVTSIWLLLAMRQGDVTFVATTLTFKGIPEGMAISRVVPEDVTARIRSTSALAPSPQQLNLLAEIDLANLKEGQNTLRITPSMVRVPAGISVIAVEPSSVRVTIRSSKK